MAVPDFDESRLPLLIIGCRPGAIEPDEFEVYLAHLDRTLAKGRPFAFLLDTTGSDPLSARLRRRKADWITANRQSIKQLCVASAVVMTSALVRGTITAVLWLQPELTPYRFTATRREAEAWCVERLAAAGLDVAAR